MSPLSPRSVMIVAGDPSGDRHAAEVLRKLKQIRPECPCFGIGGSSMQDQGFQPLMPFEPFNKMGLAEVLIHLPFFLSAKKRLTNILDEKKPSVLVCVDYPGMNMLLMKEAKRRGIPVLWYIVPQVWAWKKKRAQVLGETASVIATVFPFEEQFFAQYDARVEFVGHPLVENLKEKGIGLRTGKLEKGHPLRLALIPGSRAQEVRHMLTPMLEAYRLLKKDFPDLHATLSQVPHLPERLFHEASGHPDIAIHRGSLDDLLVASDCAIVTSGTATLQTALHQVPLVIAYKTSALTYQIFSRLVHLPHIGLPNIVAGEKVAPECIQGEVTGKHLTAALASVLQSDRTYQETVQKLGSLRSLLGDKHPSTRVAELIVELGA